LVEVGSYNLINLFSIVRYSTKDIN